MADVLLWITAIGSGVTALATIGLVLVAGRALGGTGDQVKLLREQVQREGRPYLVLDVVPGLHGPGSWDLRIRNVGRTMAREVTVEVAGLTIRDETDDISGYLLQYLETPREIAPGSGQRVMWRSEADPTTKQTEEGAPASAQAVAKYVDWTGLPYQEPFDLSVDLYGAISPVPVSYTHLTLPTSDLV